jgi:hypothetical protein
MLRGLKEELRLSEGDFLLLEEIGDLELFSLDHPNLKRINKQWTQTFVGVLRQASIEVDSLEASASKWIDATIAADWIRFCDQLTNSCRACNDSTNIFTVSNRTKQVTSFSSYSQLMATKIRAAIQFLDSYYATVVNMDE